MIEKKITYDINIEKPSKTKPVKQGGVLNYLGKQKTVNAPVKWRSSKDHPIAHLSYITKDEEKILIDLNLYGSLKGKPNRGPFGLPSLQGSGGGSGGDGGGGDGGGGGDSGGDSGDSGDSGDGEGSSNGSGGGVGGDDGAGASNAGDAGVGTGDSAGVGGSGDSTSGEGVGSGPGGEEGTGGVSASTSTSGVSDAVNAVTGFARNTIANAINNPVATAIGIAMGPVAGLAARGISNAISAANRGVTGPSDDTQEATSVQSGPSQSPSGGGGLSTLPQYAPLINPYTGDNLVDALVARYRANLPYSSFGI
jgi:hypothetical protein